MLIMDRLECLKLGAFFEPFLDIFKSRSIKALVELNISELGVKLEISKTKLTTSYVSSSLGLKLLIKDTQIVFHSFQGLIILFNNPGYH
jgi:hypothetical protein